jgi:Family of unknown function (DUF6519)
MKGDFSRDTFRQLNHYARVLHQQGRVQLDADVNEQTSILLHLLRTLGADLIGPHGGPKDGLGFEIEKVDSNLKIKEGHYYIDGLLIENEKMVDLNFAPPNPGNNPIIVTQPYRRMGKIEFDLLAAGKICIIYLDAWEHHVTYLENDHIREVALGGPDTATRAQVVWQVRVEIAPTIDGSILAPSEGSPLKISNPHWQKWITLHEGASPKMRARINNEKTTDPDPCSISPEARYRGLENQLYRVEIHHSGMIPPASSSDPVPTFKWSRENGSVLTGWTELNKNRLTVFNSEGFEMGNWVELLDDWHELERIPGILVKVVRVEDNILVLDETSATGPLNPENFDPDRHRKVRRWDHVAPGIGLDGAMTIGEFDEATPAKSAWIPLENGLEIEFKKLNAHYRTGDYWLIPARVLLPPPDQIEWPNNEEIKTSEFLEPHGVKHHYAPLAYWSGTTLTSQRRIIEPIAK